MTVGTIPLYNPENYKVNKHSCWISYSFIMDNIFESLGNPLLFDFSSYWGSTSTIIFDIEAYSIG